MKMRKKIILSQSLLALGWGIFLWYTGFQWIAFVLGSSLFFLNGMILFSMLRPVQRMIDRINRQERIDFGAKEPAEEFRMLATSINTLMDQIHKQGSVLTHQKEKTEEILESIQEGIIAADPSARVIFANTAACHMLGVPKGQLLGQILQGEGLLQKSHELLIHALQTAESAKYTWVVKSKGIYDLLSMPLTQKDGALLVLQDKTSDYRILEVGKEFIANASHELRTPITIIRGFAETLHDMKEISQEMWKEIVQKIVNTCIRLDKLVHSLLTLTDLENVSQERFTKVELVSLVERCMQTLLSLHPKVKIHFHVHEETIYTVVHSDLLELAVMNLLENAVKYSKDTAEIEISLAQTQEVVQLKIQDHGIGIAEEDLLKIFERFYTVDKARSRKKGGAGLGLSIVKTIVEKHRGKVLVASELGKGSTFTLALPL